MTEIIRWQRRLAPILYPASLAYGGLMKVRRFAWESGVLPRHRSKCPCVAVGNIGWGGSGKTPLVQWLANREAERGGKAVILTRGYRGDPPRLPYPVGSDSLPAQAGDEALMLARTCPEASVIVDPSRKRAARWAEQNLTPDLFILDDGFQHLAADRDINIVMLRPSDLDHQWNRVIPAGSWREPAGALSRADAFVIKATPGEFEELEPEIRARLARLCKPVFSLRLEPARLSPLGSAAYRATPPSASPYVLATGVADPSGVIAEATEFLGAAPLRILKFPDHHDFTLRDWHAIVAACRAIGGSGRDDIPAPLVCTPKDAVKIERIASQPPEGSDGFAHPVPACWVLEPNIRFGAHFWSELHFPEWWDSLRSRLA